MERGNRGAGVLLALACGDALGRPVEFKSAKRIEDKHGQVTDMLGDGTHGKESGTVTDDTEQAMCVAQSLVARKTFDPTDVADRFVEWYESGPFDAGRMTVDAIRRLKQGKTWDNTGSVVWESRPEGQNAGNGSVMRSAPYAIAFAESLETVVNVSLTSSAITHADPRCTYGCAILNRTLAGLITGEEDPLEKALDLVGSDAPEELADALAVVPDDIAPEELQSSGYVVHTLQSALYHGLTASSASEGIIEAVNMGQDTDTVGAVTGAIVGARFGADSLPDEWLDALTVEKRGHPPRTGQRKWVQDWLGDNSLESVLRHIGEKLATVQIEEGFELSDTICNYAGDGR